MEFRFGYKKVWGGCQQYNQTFTLPIDIVSVYHPVRNMLTGPVNALRFTAEAAAGVVEIGQ